MSATINFNNTAYFGQSIKSKLAGKKCTVLGMFNEGLIDLFGLVDVDAIKTIVSQKQDQVPPTTPVPQVKPSQVKPDPALSLEMDRRGTVQETVPRPNTPRQGMQDGTPSMGGRSATATPPTLLDVMKSQLWTYIHYLWKNNKDSRILNATSNTRKYSPWFPKMSGADGVASAQHFVEVVNQFVPTPGDDNPLRIPTIDQLCTFINQHINTYNITIPFAGMIYKRTLERLQKETHMAEDEFKIIQDHIDKINMYTPNTHRKIVEGKLGVIVSTDGERFEEVTPTKVSGLQQVRNLDPATGVSIAYREQRGRNTNPV